MFAPGSYSERPRSPDGSGVNREVHAPFCSCPGPSSLKRPHPPRSQAHRSSPHENLIKLHKAQLASDHMSCHSAIANQVRLVLHTAAFWLVHGVRAAIPRTNPLASSEFATIRDRGDRSPNHIESAGPWAHVEKLPMDQSIGLEPA
jgi:Transposase DDE domain group 1